MTPLGFRSPYLNAPQKEALRELEEALRADQPEPAQAAMSRFVGQAVTLTLQALDELGRSPTLADMEALRQTSAESQRHAALLGCLWNEGELTPLAELLLNWSESPREPPAPAWTVEQLNHYLSASVDFYQQFPPRALENAAAVPTWTLPPVELETAPGFSEVVRELAGADLPPSAPCLEPEAKPPEEPEVEPGVEVLEASSAPLSPLERSRQLIVKKKYLGYGKNTEGVMGYCGQLILSRFDEGSLQASLDCSNPLLFLSSRQVSGTKVVLTYWMPPVAFPQPGGHLTINNEGQKRVLPVTWLFPRSRTDFLSPLQVALLLMAPALLGSLYFCLVFLLSARQVAGATAEVFPEAFAAASAGSLTVGFREEGVGLYQLEVLPTSESLQLIWATVIFLAPLVSAKLFRHLSHRRRRRYGGVLVAGLLCPSVGLLLTWQLQKKLFPFLEHPDFWPLDLRHFFPWALLLNFLVGLYLFLSVHGVWDRKLPTEVRVVLPWGLTALYAVAVFVLIFGRSWWA